MQVKKKRCEGIKFGNKIIQIDCKTTKFGMCFEDSKNEVYSYL